MTDTATILIVDDEVKNRRLLEVLLQPEGYRTVTAATGEEALAAVGDGHVDLILLDVMMPGMNGYEVAAALKAEQLTRSIPIIMITALVDRPTRLAALSAGVEEFLIKPVDRAELWLRVRNLLRLKEYADFQSRYSADLELQVAERSGDLQRFRLAMDATLDAIILANRTTMTFVEVNATASAMLGYTREELLAQSPDQLYTAPPGVMEAGFDAIIANGDGANLATVQLRRKDGSYFPVEVHTHAHRSADDWIIVAVLHDVTEQKAADERLQHLAHYDSLTGLPNRELFYQTLRKTTELATDKGWTVAVMFLDIDHFKNVNDTLGHGIGDALLTQVADRLVHCVRIRDTVGRLGGDEFALIIAMEDGHDGAASVARDVRRALRAPFQLNGQEVTITASIGITVHPDDATEPATLIKYADTAMYRAKQAGRDTFRFFTAQMNTDLLARMDLERALRMAVDKEQFVLHYQPKVQLSTGHVVGVEALLRWERPGHGLVAPNDFIPVLESTGMIVEVGSWVIAEAGRQIAAWSASDIGPLRIAVNVAGQQFVHGDIDADVAAALRVNKIPADLMELELTESSLITDTDKTIATLRRLKARGVQLSIDDFGTGYSCLAYLRHFPIDKLKIDVAFVRHVTDNADDAAMARTIIRMAHSLKLEVIAEGVENAAQLSFLSRQGCDQIQGYLISRALPAAELEALVRDRSPVPSATSAAAASRTSLLIVSDDAAALVSLRGLLAPDGYRIFSVRSMPEALEVLALHHVHVIVCDDDAPSLDAANFFERVKTLHPDPLRVMLSDGLNAHALIRGVNIGGVHAFAAKPWNDVVLRDQVRDAFKHYRFIAEMSSLRPGAAVVQHNRISVAT